MGDPAKVLYLAFTLAGLSAPLAWVFTGVALHHSRIERAPGAAAATPSSAEVESLRDEMTPAAPSASASSPVPDALPGCFNAGVSRMLTNWKES